MIKVALVAVVALAVCTTAGASPGGTYAIPAGEAPSTKKKAATKSQCPYARAGVRFYRNTFVGWTLQRGASIPTWRRPRNCADARHLANVWAKRSSEARKKLIVWKKNETRRERRALYAKWECIHSHEGAWNANTGNGYYGGLQMDHGFMRTYGSEFIERWGYAHKWPVWAQLTAAERAYHGYAGFGGRGFGPWPNTRRMCGV